MTEKETKLAELEKQLTPRGAFEAAHWGTKLPEGCRFLETYAEIRKLEGSPVVVEYQHKKAA